MVFFERHGPQMLGHQAIWVVIDMLSPFIEYDIAFQIQAFGVHSEICKPIKLQFQYPVESMGWGIDVELGPIEPCRCICAATNRFDFTIEAPSGKASVPLNIRCSKR